MTSEFISWFTNCARLSPNISIERDAQKAARPLPLRWTGRQPMGFTLDKVVPWRRSYDKYVSIFGLLHKRNRQNSKVQGGSR